MKKLKVIFWQFREKRIAIIECLQPVFLMLATASFIFVLTIWATDLYASVPISDHASEYRVSSVGVVTELSAELNALFVERFKKPRLIVNSQEVASDIRHAYSVVLGDVDNDGDLDLIAGTANFPMGGAKNRLYLNDGTPDTLFTKGTDISQDIQNTYSVALADMDNDGDLDLIIGNFGVNRLYLNNGTQNPFADTLGTNISDDEAFTTSIAVGDVDGDGDMDLIAGNFGSTNRLYLNNGTSEPFDRVSGSDVSSDAQLTVSVVLGDMDGDGNPDLVVGNFGVNRLYLNTDPSNPFGNAIGENISENDHFTYSMAIGDVDGDGDLDVIAGNGMAPDLNEPNRLYLNNGTRNPFAGVIGKDISGDRHATSVVCLGDFDGDGDLDLIAGNKGMIRFYANNGTVDPFAGVGGEDFDTDARATISVALGDIDSDGDLDMIVGNMGPNRLYINNTFETPGEKLTGMFRKRLLPHSE